MAKPVPVSFPPPGFDDLSVDEKIDYLQSLWDRIAATPVTIPVSGWHREIIDERLKISTRIRTSVTAGRSFRSDSEKSSTAAVERRWLVDSRFGHSPRPVSAPASLHDRRARDVITEHRLSRSPGRRQPECGTVGPEQTVGSVLAKLVGRRRTLRCADQVGLRSDLQFRTASTPDTDLSASTQI